VHDRLTKFMAPVVDSSWSIDDIGAMLGLQRVVGLGFSGGKWGTGRLRNAAMLSQVCLFQLVCALVARWLAGAFSEG
jgi:hypothetical protein